MNVRPYAARLSGLAASPAALPAFLLGVAIVYTLAYLGHPVLPGNSAYPEGWWGWWDQGHYLKCAATIANGALTSETYVYPLGYSLVAAPFYLVAPRHAFFIPNLFFVLGSVWTFVCVARRVISSIEVYALLLLFVFCYRGMLSDSLVVPWNTIATHFLLYVILYLTAWKRPTVTEVYVAIGCLSALYVFKMVEFICALPIVGMGILSLRDRRTVLKTVAIAGVAVGSVIGAMMLIHRSVFGGIWSSYELNQRAIGVAAYSFPQKLYLLFVSGGPVFREAEPMLLSHAPWLVLIVPGVIYVLRRFGAATLGMLFSFVACFGLYISYNDLGPGNLFRYNLIHYFAWMFPFFFLITYLGFKEGWKTRLGRWSFSSVPFLLAVLCFVSLREKTVGGFIPSDTTAIKILAAIDSSIDWIFLHGAKTVPTIIADGVPRRSSADYQYSLRSDGVSFLLSKRISGRSLEIDAAGAKEVLRVDYGELRWCVRWAPQWLLYQWTRRFTPAHVSLLGQQPGVDVAGPSGTPDGNLDQVITVDLPGWVMGQIGHWQIELPDNRGRWLSSANTQGIWLIAIDFPTELQRGRLRRVVRLCFPDNGNVDSAPVVRLRALDPMGQIVIESQVRRR